MSLGRRIVVTGCSGRIGRAIRAALRERGDETIGIDIRADSGADSGTTHLIDIARERLPAHRFAGADAVVHVAALHAPHVGVVTDAEFQRINIDGTRRVLDAAAAADVPRLVFTSTTALYGDACIASDAAVWVDETLTPRPRTIYHRSKLAAEALLQEAAAESGPSLRILRMSRCFPEPADAMAVLRLHRGIDVRDVATAHLAAIAHAGAACDLYVISGASPFLRTDAAALRTNAAEVIGRRCPALVSAFAQRRWTLPASIDRVYCADRAIAALNWRPQFGFAEVLRQYDACGAETLPPHGAYLIDGDLRDAAH